MGPGSSAEEVKSSDMKRGREMRETALNHLMASHWGAGGGNPHQQGFPGKGQKVTWTFVGPAYKEHRSRQPGCKAATGPHRISIGLRYNGGGRSLNPTLSADIALPLEASRSLPEHNVSFLSPPTPDHS